MKNKTLYQLIAFCLFAMSNPIYAEKPLKEIQQIQQKAEQGDAEAQVDLGFMHHTGQGVKKSYPTAVKWHQKAAEQGHADAQFNLGVMYAQGQGVRKNHILAYAWFSEAAANGSKTAKESLQTLEKIMTAEQIAKAKATDPLKSIEK